jgi:AP-1-like factor
LRSKYNKLEASYLKLNSTYEKLHKRVELLTQDDDAEARDEAERKTNGKTSESNTLRRLLNILHGEFKCSTSAKAGTI